jgi:transposase
MFVRAKKSGRYEYLQVVHNERVNGRVQQRVIATLGRLDVLRESGQIDALISSCSRFAEYTAVLDAHRRGETLDAQSIRVGPPLVFEKIWRDLKIPEVIESHLRGRRFEFSVERALFLTVLHRLFPAGSDRAAERWHQRYAIRGVENIDLHHLYRAMGWLGEPLPDDKQFGATPFAPRCTKDSIEERLFQTRRDILTTLDVVFFDTTSIYFEGRGGDTVGQYGNSKDHRPDRKQMIVGVVLDNEGRPVCCELWPGNTADVKSLLPVVDRLKERFHIGTICVVADRGMISSETIKGLKATHRDCRFILGARLRAIKEIREDVLSRPGRYKVASPARKKSKDPAPLKVKEVWIEDRRYIVCVNEEQERKDRADRQAIILSLIDQLSRGDKSLVGNKGYRKYLKVVGDGHFAIDDARVKGEERFDGKWVLQTDMDMSPEDVALKYKELWMVEATFRQMKSVLETRPIYHKCDETIRGHVFCSFLSLVVLKELFRRIEERGWRVEWERLKDDLDAIEDIHMDNGGRRFVIRTSCRGDAGKAIQAAGVSLGPTVRQASDDI